MNTLLIANTLKTLNEIKAQLRDIKRALDIAVEAEVHELIWREQEELQTGHGVTLSKGDKPK